MTSPNAKRPKTPTGRSGSASALCVLPFLPVALTGVLRRASTARQARTAREGVYTAAQAARGQALYGLGAPCATATALEGAIGPPLAGQRFLGIWGALPVSDLFDKIHSTMPADAPGTLTRPQVADLVRTSCRRISFPPAPWNSPPRRRAQADLAWPGRATAAASRGDRDRRCHFPRPER